eukprot:40984-Eustigmatos_ZCMA.PRE.1
MVLENPHATGAPSPGVCCGRPAVRAACPPSARHVHALERSFGSVTGATHTHAVHRSADGAGALALPTAP